MLHHYRCIALIIRSNKTNITYMLHEECVNFFNVHVHTQITHTLHVHVYVYIHVNALTVLK